MNFKHGERVAVTKDIKRLRIKAGDEGKVVVATVPCNEAMVAMDGGPKQWLSFDVLEKRGRGDEKSRD